MYPAEASHIWNDFSVDDYYIYGKLDGMDKETASQLAPRGIAITTSHTSRQCDAIERPPDYWWCPPVRVTPAIRFQFISHCSEFCYDNNFLPCWFANWLAVSFSVPSNLIYFLKSILTQLRAKSNNRVI